MSIIKGGEKYSSESQFFFCSQISKAEKYQWSQKKSNFLIAAVHWVQNVFHLSPKSNSSVQSGEDSKVKYCLWSAHLSDNMESNYSNTENTVYKGLCTNISKNDMKRDGEIGLMEK